MSKEIIDNILAFVNETENEPVNEPQPEPLRTKSEPEPQAEQQPTNQPTNDQYFDDKVFKSFSRKCSKTENFPVVIDGRIFNSKDELLSYKHDIIVRRRENRRTTNEKKINETRMKTNKMSDVNLSDEENVVEHEGMLYKVGQPYAIKVGDKVKKIPKTSKKDTKAIVEEVKRRKGKNGLTELLQTEEPKFTETTEKLTNDSDEEFKDMLYNHLHNEFVNDKTFNKTTYIRYMRELMEENAKLKKEKLQREANTPQRQFSNPFGLNPKLLGKI